MQELRTQIQALKQQRKELKSSQKGETDEQRKKNRGASPPGAPARPVSLLRAF